MGTGHNPGVNPPTVQALMEEAILRTERRLADPGAPLPFSKSLRRALTKVFRILEAHRDEFLPRWEGMAREALGGEGGQLGAFILQDFQDLITLDYGEEGEYLERLRGRTQPMAMAGTPMNRMLRALEAEGEVLLGLVLENVPPGQSLWRCTRAVDRLLFNRLSVVTEIYFDSFRRGAEILQDVLAEITDIEENLWDGVLRMATTRPDPKGFLADVFNKYLEALNLFMLTGPPVRRSGGLQEALEGFAAELRKYFGCEEEEYTFLQREDGTHVNVGAHCFYAERCLKQQALGMVPYCFKTRSMEVFVGLELGRPVAVDPLVLDPGHRCHLRVREVPGIVPPPSSFSGEAPKRPEAHALVEGLPPLDPGAPLDAPALDAIVRTADALEPYVHRVLLEWAKLATNHFQPRDLTLLYRVIRVDLVELGEFLRAGEVDRYLREWGDFSRHLADGGVPLSQLVKAVKLQGEATLTTLMVTHPVDMERVVKAQERLTRERLLLAARAYRDALREDALSLGRVIDQYNVFTDAIWIALTRRAKEEGDPMPFLQAFMDLQFDGFLRAQARRRPLPPSSGDLLHLTRGIAEWMRTLPESPAYTATAEPRDDGVSITIHRGCPNEARCLLMAKQGIPFVCVEALYFRSYARSHGHDVSIRQGHLDPGRSCTSVLAPANVK